jgi:CubicO group peptidase (beta-lactamase class C family)
VGLPDPIQRIHERLSQLAELGFCGTALAAFQGEILLHQGYGWANRERGFAMQPETGMSIGSLVKLFTLAAVLKLESAGSLNLSTSIDAYLPDLPQHLRGILVEHLLRHTSGLPDIIDAQGKPIEYSLEYDYLPVERDELLHKAYLTQLHSPPGERKAYSNLGYSLLGILIEIASGEPYERFVNAHLFQPAGMTKTGYLLPTWEKEDLATGYQDGQAWGMPRTHGRLEDGPSWNLRANGGMTSTVGDLYRWMVGIEAARSLTTAERRKHDELLVRTLSGGRRIMGPAGGNGIFNTVFVWYPDERRFLALASSDSRYQAEDYTRELLGHLEELS